MFITTGDTSAAAALAARFAAMLQAQYPALWPETIRGLMIHCAEWTNVMKKEYISTKDKTIKTNELKLYELPWPRDILQELGEKDVELRITLSYFIEANPGGKGRNRKFSYTSHGLRFKLKTPTESMTEFRKRINKAARDEEESVWENQDSEFWLLGEELRTRGSLHHDKWIGPAAFLAERGVLAIYPVGGWWRYRDNKNHWNDKARYSLLISIHSEDVSVNLYSSIKNEISVEL